MDGMVEAGQGTPSSRPAGGATWRVASVAERVGVAAGTLRTWARRYGLGPSLHAAGEHRRYTTTDVARLIMMRKLIGQGIPPGEAAPIALAHTVNDAERQVAQAYCSPPQAATSSPALASVPALTPDRLYHSISELVEPARSLGISALRMDSLQVYEMVLNLCREQGVLPTWNDAVLPVLRAISDHWQRSGEGVELEHQLSEQVAQAMATYTHELRPQRGLLLLAGADEEQHALPLAAVAAGAAELGIRSVTLGPRVPHASLEVSARRLSPALVFVFALMRPDPKQLAELHDFCAAHRTLLGGPGWAGNPVPRGVPVVNSLAEALERLHD